MSVVEYLDRVYMREYGTAPIGLSKFGTVPQFLCSRLHENCGTIPNGSRCCYREGVQTIHILTSFAIRFFWLQVVLIWFYPFTRNQSGTVPNMTVLATEPKEQ